MSARFRARRHQVRQVVARTRQWAMTHQDVRASFVVGSYAYGRPRMGSDVDILFLTETPQAHLVGLEFVSAIVPGARLVRAEQWGPLHERRVRLPSGLLVEFGISTPQWCALPLDAGTARVLTDGCKILTDDGLVRDALTALGKPATQWRE